LELHTKIQYHHDPDQAGLHTDYQGMTALHILLANPHVSGNDIALLKTYLYFCSDTPPHHLSRNIIGCILSIVESDLEYFLEAGMVWNNDGKTVMDHLCKHSDVNVIAMCTKQTTV
jgi:hypothetical protein